MTTTYEESWIAGPRSTQFYTRVYKATSPKAILVFVHGFIEHIGRYEHIHPKWAERGITLFTFDQRGFGKTATDIEHKSKDSSYGKTSWPDQLTDIEWALKHAKSEFGDLPLFLMGHSMGGALSLAFVTRSSPPPDSSTVSSLRGIISTSPLLLQTVPSSKLLRWVGGKVATIKPDLIISAPVNAKDLSHDPDINAAYVKDPLVKECASVRCIGDMLNGGEHLLRVDYQRWPKDLPILLCHGTADKVTSPKASEAFEGKLVATDKKLTLYEGGYHELHNEPDGVGDKLIEECISWVEAHLIETGPTASKL